MEETKIIYHIDEEDTPYLIRLPIPPEKATLADFKNALNRPSYKFFFKSVDADFGVVKEEIADENASLPCINGRVVSWLVTADGEGSVHSDTNSHHQLQQQQQQQQRQDQQQAGGAIGNNGCDSCTDDSESVYSASQRGDRVAPLRSFSDYKQHAHRINVGRVFSRHQHGGASSATYESASSMLSSDLDTTSFFDSEDDAESSRFSSATNTTYSVNNRHLQQQQQQHHRQQRQQRRRRRVPPISRTSSFSSITESTMSLNVQTVELDMDAVQFLGISIVGHPAVNGGSGGIYVGSIMRGGAVEREGSIQPGDMLLEVNGIAFDSLENDEAVRILREQVQKPGKISLVVAKCWDSRDYLRVPREEPVRPIDPRAWVLHTNAMRQDASGAAVVSSGATVTPAGSCVMTSTAAPSAGVGGGGMDSNLCDSRLTVTAASVSTSSCSLPECERYTSEELLPSLTVRTDLLTIAKSMAMPESGLEVRDRTWLKITIPRAFIGSDLVDWLFSRVEGFTERKEARKMALEMLRRGCIRHTVNKVSFSEQCYYVFGESVLAAAAAAAAAAGAGGLDSAGPGASGLGAGLSNLSLRDDQNRHQHQQHQHLQHQHQGYLPPPPPPQGTWGAPPPSYPSLYGGGGDSSNGGGGDSLSQYSSLLMQQSLSAVSSSNKTPTAPMMGALPPANSAAAVISDNSDSSSASSSSRHSAGPRGHQSHHQQQQQYHHQQSQSSAGANGGGGFRVAMNNPC